MNKADEKRTAYYLIPASGSDLDLDSDLLRQLDGVVEVADSADVPHLLSRMVALEAYLNESYALFPGERDTEGVNVAEYPFA